jgi:L-asparaginase
MNNANLVHIIITGGTLDSFYNGIKDTVSPSKESVLPRYFANLKLKDVKIEFTTICMKDSREIDDQDRQKLLKTIEESNASKILITHGTYTMPDSARFIKANLKRNDQAIIFTASMIPLDGFNLSDAPFNLGFAYAKLIELKAGIYVAINGRIFTPEEVMKDLSKGEFSSIFNK